MAATDPKRRSEAASIAARTRINRMTELERRRMTLAARLALRALDLAQVDAEARTLGQYPLDEDTRNFRANVLQAARARRAAAEAQRLHTSRATQTAHQR